MGHNTVSLAREPRHNKLFWLSDFRGHSLLNCPNCVGVFPHGVSIALSLSMYHLGCIVVWFGVIELVSLASKSGHSVLGRVV